MAVFQPHVTVPEWWPGDAWLVTHAGLRPTGGGVGGKLTSSRAQHFCPGLLSRTWKGWAVTAGGTLSFFVFDKHGEWVPGADGQHPEVLERRSGAEAGRRGRVAALLTQMGSC